MPTIRFAPLDVRTADFAQLAALRRRQVRADTPQWPAYDAEVTRDSMRTSNPAVRVENWQGIVDGRMIAFADMLLPREEGNTSAHIEGIVHPGLRRNGIGSALFQLLRRRAAAAGRTVMSTVAIAGLPHGGMSRGVAGEEFCRRHGMAKALTSIRSRLDLSGLAAERLSDLEVEARRAARGYEVLTWSNTAADDDMVSDLAYLQTRMGTDMPRGELAWRPLRHDVARWRGMETMTGRRHRTVYYAAARHRASGRLVGYTSAMLPQRPRSHAQQQTTIVDPTHRGHRIGLWIKLSNVAQMRQAEPRLRYVHTMNAESNAHMVAINDAMGFQPCDAAVSYQLHLNG